MRLLADENFPGPLVDLLRAEGHDVARSGVDFPSSKDNALLDLAELEARILLTLDRDFWQIAAQRRSPLTQSGVVLFRIHPAIPANLRALVRMFVKSDRIWVGQVSIVSRRGIEMVAARRGLQEFASQLLR